MAKRENSSLELRVAEETTREWNDSETFPELLLIVAKRKRLVFTIVAAGAVLSLTLALVLRNMYTATTRLMPPQQNQSISSSAILSQLGPLAALAGQGLGLKTPSDLYVAMLRSQTIADALIDRYHLMSTYRVKKRVEAQKELEERTLIVAGKEGVISVSVDDRDPQTAAAMANDYVNELELLTRKLAVTEAGKRRAFFERETKMAMDDLANAEQNLKETQEKTGLIILEPQSRAMIETIESLRARIASQEVLIQSMGTFATAENPELIRARQELAAYQQELTRLERKGGNSILDMPIEKIPTAGLEYIRKLREVKYRETLFEMLAKQYEVAKLDEARDALIVQQLDSAKPPEKKSGPLRAVILVCGTVLAMFVAGFTAYFLERLERAKENPHFSARLQLFKFYLRSKPSSPSSGRDEPERGRSEAGST